MAKRLLAVSVLLFAPLSSSAQTPQPNLNFGGHRLGESANVFFLTAKTSGTKLLVKDYCNSPLSDAKTKEQVRHYEDVQKVGGVFSIGQGEFSFLDLEDCKQVMMALEGKKANVGAKLAVEIGRGFALFASGKLSAFNLRLDSSYPRAVSDLEKRFGFAGKKDTVARSEWPPLQEMRWEREGVLAAVFNVPFSDSVVALVGLLEPPYESLLRGTPVPESSVFSPETCRAKATMPNDTTRISVRRDQLVGQLCHRVSPIYPEIAKRSAIQGNRYTGRHN